MLYKIFLITSLASLQISLTDASLLEETYQTKENEQHNQTYAIEEQILKLVRTDNYKGFNNIEFSDSNYHLGVTGSTALRQLKNDIIITTTICTRAAIEGGLDYDSAFILRCKLEEGKELLQYTNKSISTISTFLCFSSQSHFQTAFKKQFGITPAEYRRNG